jgi:hypothetical protein
MKTNLFKKPIPDDERPRERLFYTSQPTVSCNTRGTNSIWKESFGSVEIGASTTLTRFSDPDMNLRTATFARNSQARTMTGRFQIIKLHPSVGFQVVHVHPVPGLPEGFTTSNQEFSIARCTICRTCSTLRDIGLGYPYTIVALQEVVAFRGKDDGATKASHTTVTTSGNTEPRATKNASTRVVSCKGRIGKGNPLLIRNIVSVE